MNQAALWDQTYQKHQPAMLQFALRRTANHDEAQDAVMEAFERIAPHLAEVAPQAVSSYWRTAILNGIITGARRRHIVQFLSMEAEAALAQESGLEMQYPSLEPPIHRALENRDLQCRVRVAVMKLNDEHREVVMRHYFHDQDLETIERETGVKLGTVKSRLHRARHALERHLGSAL